VIPAAVIALQCSQVIGTPPQAAVRSEQAVAQMSNGVSPSRS
jgi:hypothetical protein